MPRDEGNIISQRPKLFTDRSNQCLMITLREIRAPDTALKKDIADRRQLGVRLEENDMARRMSGAMPNIEAGFSHGDPVTTHEPSVGLERTGAINAPFLAIFLEPIDPETIIFMRPLDRDAQPIGHNGDTTAMIGVPVGNQNFLERDPLLLGNGQKSIDVTARIDKGALHRLGAPDQCTVLLKRRYRTDRRLDRRLGAATRAHQSGPRRFVADRLDVRAFRQDSEPTSHFLIGLLDIAHIAAEAILIHLLAGTDIP